MKNTQLKIVMLLALIALQFTSCDNEPLEGQFTIEEEPIGTAGPGEFRAVVGEDNFFADTIEAVFITDSNSLVLSGTIAATGQKIELGVEGVGQGTYSLAYTGTTESRGVYYDPVSLDRPYKTFILAGGNGQMSVTDLDSALQIVSGTFQFNALREVLDDAGNVVIGADGTPIYEEVAITIGSFNTIPFTVIETNDDQTDDDDDEDPIDPEDSFFAKVDEINFVPTSIDVIETEVGGIPMLNVVGTNAAGAKIRIDIPRSQGTGTFAFETDISDGTDLIALYNNGNGGENLSSNPGTITITEFGSATGKLAATFQFTGTDPLGIDPTVVEITEGAFAVDFIDNGTTITNEFNADVDGIPYAASMIEVIQQDFLGMDVLAINATDSANNQYIQVNFPKDLAVGSYAMSEMQVIGDEVSSLYVPDIGVSGNFSSTVGTLTITSFDAVNQIYEGSFSFTGEDLSGNDPTIYDISNGSFIIQVQ